MLSHIKDSQGNWTVVTDNKSYQFGPSHPEYMSLVECVRSGDATQMVELIDTGSKIENWSNGSFRFRDGVLYYVDEQVHSAITNRIVEMIKQNFDVDPILNFLKRLYQNPSYRAIHELYEFLSHKFLPITPEGYFLAYKAVKRDFTDKYSGKMNNSVGETVSMPRFRVDDNCDIGCSQGLHVGAIDYVKSYGSAGDKVIICKIDPADVVSVPLDSDHKKLRCCKYEVVGEYDGELLPAVVEDYEGESDVCGFFEYNNEEPNYDECD